jgi:chemotaxis methyl-accepting protein methylase
VRVRAVRVRPDVVAAIVPRDLDLVAERLDSLDNDLRFDLVIATNVFIYYEPFEQVLAVANLARMLRSGGTLLSNQAVLPIAPMRPTVDQHTIAFSERQSDFVFRYQRQ